MIKIQTTISGYGGKPCTLLSGYKEELQVLAVSAEKEFTATRIKDCFVITNDPELERDSLFQESDFKASIAAYFSMKSGVSKDGSSARLSFSERAQRVIPANAIEIDGIDENGQKYRISETITCSQVAALATCWYADQTADSVVKALDMFEQTLDAEQAHFFGGRIMTV